MNYLDPIFVNILKPFAPKEGQHTGLVVKDLYAQVDNTLELAAEALRIRNAPICRNCRHAKGEHSHERSECPSQFFPGDLFRPTTFQSLGCQAVDARGSWDIGCECGREVVAGTEFCPSHSRQEEVL
jgi:hypothetical protein